jgi:hypothetical protein
MTFTLKMANVMFSETVEELQETRRLKPESGADGLHVSAET